MRVALLGAGRIGQLHARLLAATEGVEGVVIADLDVDRARALADATGALATAAPSTEAALDAADAAVVATVTGAHAASVEAALLDRGLPTFCEKPLALGLEETIDLARRIQACPVPFQLGFQRRFDAGYMEMRRLISSGDLGTLYAVRMVSHDSHPPHESYIPGSGGLFRDLAIHDFDALRWLTGAEVDEVYAEGAVLGFEVFRTHGDVDTAVATLRLSTGTLCVLSAGRHNPLGYDIRAEALGSKDSVTLGVGDRAPLRSVEPGATPPAGPGWDFFLDRFEAAYAAELAEFVRVASGAAPSPCTARDGVEALRIAEAATMSLEQHRPVRLAEIEGLA